MFHLREKGEGRLSRFRLGRLHSASPPVRLFFVSITAPLWPNGDIRVFHLSAIHHVAETLSSLSVFNFSTFFPLHLGASSLQSRPPSFNRERPLSSLFTQDLPSTSYHPTACHRQSVWAVAPPWMASFTSSSFPHPLLPLSPVAFSSSSARQESLPSFPPDQSWPFTLSSSPSFFLFWFFFFQLSCYIFLVAFGGLFIRRPHSQKCVNILFFFSSFSPAIDSYKRIVKLFHLFSVSGRD